MAKDYVYEPEPTQSQSLIHAPDRGQVIPFEKSAPDDPLSLRDSTFSAMGTRRVSKAQEKILLATIDPAREVEIKPTGEVYPPQIAMRRRLTKAFGPMGWALRPVSAPIPPGEGNQNVMYREFALIADGRVVASAIGSAKYYATNARMDFGDTVEAVKSDALKRCCKDLGMLSELWDVEFIEDWRNEFAVHVFMFEKDRKDPTKRITKDQWRRVDRKPFPTEIEPVSDSPNQDKWRKQMAAWRAMLDAETARTKQVVAEVRASKSAYVAARKDAEAAGVVSPRATSTHAEQRETQRPEPEKPAATQRDARPATVHAPHAVRTDDKPFMIKRCFIAVKKTANNSTLYGIEMMDGSEYFTFSSRIYEDMGKHWAARDKIIIQHETQKAGGKSYRHILEWQIRKDGGS
jgi:Mitochondrial genome maintenance MGM101